MKVNQPFPSFVQGVSQQPPALRSPAHATELLNGFTSAVDGLSKRPPTEYVAKLVNAATADAKIHPFSKSTDEEGYVIIPGDGTVQVKTFNGFAQSVSIIGAAGTYVTVADPQANLELITVADYTFVVNKQIVPALKSDTYRDTSATPNYKKACVWVREPLAQCTYNVTLTGGTGVSATYNPHAVAADIETINIATQLKTQIDTHGTPAFTCTQLGSVLFPHRSGSAFDISVSDGQGNSAMVLLNGSTNSPANLPPNALGYFQVEITGSEDTSWDNYWVEWDATKKAWLEIPAPGRRYKIDPATMPHALRFVSAGIYSFEPIDWDDCLAGDTTTNPPPSFIGRPINDIFFYRGRLGMLTDATVVMSEAGNLFNFWRTTTTGLIDSDPIDVKVSQKDPAPLKWAVEYDETVIFWSQKGQYPIAKNVQILSPKTFAISAATSYESDVSCEPTVVGDRIYYARKHGLYSSLRDFYPKADAEGKLTFGSESLTDHAPRYILGTVTQLKGASTGDLLLAITDQGSNKVYAYQFSFARNVRVQSAIHSWVFDENSVPVSVVSNGGYMLFLMLRNDGVFIEQCDISPQARDTGMAIKMLLDHRVDESDCLITYSSGTGLSTITLPFSDVGASTRDYQVYGRYSASANPLQPGELAEDAVIVDDDPAVVIHVTGDFRSAKFYVGKNYMLDYEFSPIILRDRQSGQPSTGGRLQISRIVLNYGDTGYMRATVQPGSRQQFTYTLTGYQLGSSRTLIGSIPVVSGSFKVPVQTNNLNVEVHILNDTPFPTKLLNGDWEGQYGNQSVTNAARF